MIGATPKLLPSFLLSFYGTQPGFCGADSVVNVVMSG